MEEIRVTGWNDLQDHLLEHAWNPGIKRFRSPYAFRGRGVDEALVTGLARLGGPYAEMERHLLRNFRKYAHWNVVEADSIWHWLALAQHHGLPTRLLDWTYSPLVAMHFATADVSCFDQDGVIWAVNFSGAHAHVPERLRSELEAVQADVFTLEMLARAAPSLEELAGLAAEPFPLFFEPPSLDERIVNQYALFSVMSAATAQFGEWLAAHAELARRIVIPAEIKWEVRDKLDQSNITERVLFPGLDGLSAWLRRLYTLRL